MKPESIDWNTYRGYGDPLPDEDKQLLISYRNIHMYGDQLSKATEGKYTKVYDEIDINMAFVDNEGNRIFGVYAWAYKPECMMGKVNKQ